MAFPAVNEIWEVRVVCYSASQIGVNTVHYRITQATNPIGDNIAAAQISLALAPLYKAYLPQTANYLGVSVQRAYPLPRTRAYATKADQGPGTQLLDMMPKQVSGLIKCWADAGGPAYRGRIYLPFPCEADNDANGQPTNSWNTLATPIKNYLYSVITVTSGGNTNDWTPVIYHRAGPSNSPTIVQAQVVLKWATQKRRGDFGRINALPF